MGWWMQRVPVEQATVLLHGYLLVVEVVDRDLGRFAAQFDRLSIVECSLGSPG